MFVSFTIKNALSFKDEERFSLKASPISEHLEDNTFVSPVNEIKLLRGGALYGANSSGKSNIFRALNFVIGFAQDSAKNRQANQPIPIVNFKLNTETIDQPSYFELEFISDSKKYRYNFTVDTKSVISENLFVQRKLKEYLVFNREKNVISVEEKYSVEKSVIAATRDNALFLSMAAMLNVQWASEAIAGMDKIHFFNDTPGIPFGNDLTSVLLEEPKFRELIMKLLKAGDLGFEEVDTKLIPVKYDDSSGFIPDSAKKFFFDNKVRIVTTIHDRLNVIGEPVEKVRFNMYNEESAGTQKYYNLLGPIIEALYYGNVIIADEFTSKLHPLLAEQIIRLFHNTKINKNNAQLIIATHNTYLLNEELYRRDQIFITRKDKFLSTKIASLFNLEVRKDAIFEKKYLHDKALPGLPNWELDSNSFWQE